MSVSDWIAIASALITIIAMIISIRQAWNAATSSKKAQSALQTVQLSAIAERLKSAQEHIRAIAPGSVLRRGFNASDSLALIRREFDTAMNALPRNGDGSTARDELGKAQKMLAKYEKTIAAEPDAEYWQAIQVHVQDAVSDLSGTAIQIGTNS